MAMPNDLLLVRHGESEGNVASHASKRHDDRYYTPEFRSRHSSQWRLTDKGIYQAQQAGQWIRDNFPLPFARYITSEYIRAQETAGHLDISSGWFTSFLLRERDWGDMDVLPFRERKERFDEHMRKREIDSFYWKPPNGESMADLVLRLRWELDTLHRECAGQQVVIVCHGEVMWGFRILLERMAQTRFLELDQSRNPHDRIHNCQVLHYSRRDPRSGQISPHMNWMRSVCPSDTSLSSNNWQPIVRQRFSSQDLLERAQRVERLVND